MQVEIAKPRPLLNIVDVYNVVILIRVAVCVDEVFPPKCDVVCNFDDNAGTVRVAAQADYFSVHVVFVRIGTVSIRVHVINQSDS